MCQKGGKFKIEWKKFFSFPALDLHVHVHTCGGKNVKAKPFEMYSSMSSNVVQILNCHKHE